MTGSVSGLITRVGFWGLVIIATLAPHFSMARTYCEAVFQPKITYPLSSQTLRFKFSPQFTERHNQHLLLAKSIRAQINSGLPLSEITVDTMFFQHEVHAALVTLKSLSLTVRAKAPLTDYLATDRQRNPLTSKTRKVPTEPDLTLVQLLIHDLQAWANKPSGHYLKLMSLLTVTSWSVSNPYQGTLRDDHHLAASISSIRPDGSMTWNLKAPVLYDPRLSLESLWQENLAMIPVYIAGDLSIPELLAYWNNGLAPIGVIFKNGIIFDDISNGSSIDFLKHDWDHYGEAQLPTSFAFKDFHVVKAFKLKDFMSLMQRLDTFIDATAKTPRQYEILKAIQFHIAHEDTSTPGLPTSAEQVLETLNRLARKKTAPNMNAFYGSRISFSEIRWGVERLKESPIF